MLNEKKYFCIGLHKTGTTTLHDLALQSGLKSTHTTDWCKNKIKLNNFNFFCDGGSHFDGINEFPFRKLDRMYENAFFIINIRDIKKWIISKCKYSGWNENSKFYIKNKVLHKNWKDKNIKNISLFIDHYINWYTKVINYFIKKSGKAIIVDITSGKNVEKLKKILNNNNLKITHKNKGKRNIKLPKHIINFINYKIDVLNKNKLKELTNLINKFDKQI